MQWAMNKSEVSFEKLKAERPRNKAYPTDHTRETMIRNQKDYLQTMLDKQRAAKEAQQTGIDR